MTAPSRNIGQYLPKQVTLPVSFKKKDLLTYAIAVGCDEEKFVYTLDPDFQMFPTFPVSLFFKGDSDDAHEMRKNPVVLSADNPFPGKAYGVRTGLDGERFIECVNPLPLEGGEFVWKQEFTGIFRKGKSGILR